MSKPKGFFTYFHHEDVLSTLSNEQAGLLYKALVHYGNTGELTDFSDDMALQIAFTLFKAEVDFNFERYQKVSEIRREAGKKGGRPKKNTESNDE